MNDKKFSNEFIISDMPDENESEKAAQNLEQPSKEEALVVEMGEKAEEKKAKKGSSLSKEQKGFLAFLGGAWLVIVAVLIISLCIKTNLSKEPPMNLGNNQNVQVKITRQMIIDEEEEFEEYYDEQTDSGQIIYADENYSYDENGNLVTESTSSGETEPENTGYLLAQVKKCGDTYLLDTASETAEEKYQNSHKTYYYQKDDKLYKTYYRYESEIDQMLNPESGVWTQTPADSLELASYFDFAFLDRYDESDFQKVEDYYIPSGSLDEMFFDIIKTNLREKYSNYDLKFYINNGKMTKIVASYTFSGGQEPIEMVQTYDFTYKNEKITVPKAENK